MVCQQTRRLPGGRPVGTAFARLCTALAFFALSVVGVSMAGTPASAAGPTAIGVSGPGLEKALTVRAGDSPEQFAGLLAEVNWLSSRSGVTSSPDTAKLGDKYELTVFTGNKATQRFDLYPLAGGGPRVFRPAGQPDKHRTTAAWFYGRVSLPDTLRDAGVPLGGEVSSMTTGGIGGGEAADQPFDPNADLASLLAQWRHFLFLNGGVVVVIAVGLAGTSLLVRRRVDRLYRRAAEQGRAPGRRPPRRLR